MDTTVAVIQAKVNRLVTKNTADLSNMVDLETQLNEAISANTLDIAADLLDQLRTVKEGIVATTAEIEQLLTTILVS